jgi:hypothetical protein
MAGTGKTSLKDINLGYTYANGFVVLAEGLDKFKQGAIATGGGGVRRTSQAICPLRKENCLDRYLGVEPRRAGIALAEGRCDLEGALYLRASTIGESGPCPLFQLSFFLSVSVSSQCAGSEVKPLTEDRGCDSVLLDQSDRTPHGAVIDEYGAMVE